MPISYPVPLQPQWGCTFEPHMSNILSFFWVKKRDLGHTGIECPNKQFRLS